MITTCKLYFLIESFEKCTRSAAEGCCWRKMEKDERRRRWWFFVGKLKSKASSSDERRAAAAKLKKFYTFLLSTQLYQIKRRETSTISISKVGNWVFISKKKFFFFTTRFVFFFPNHICWRPIYLFKRKEKVSFEIVTIMCNTICQWYIIMHYSSRRSSFFVIYYEFDGVLDNLKFMHFLSSTTVHNLNWVEYVNNSNWITN